MLKLNGISFERCLTPPNAICLPILCVFSDASEDAFGTCAYVWWQLSNEEYDIRFVAVKSRAAPLKRLPIPPKFLRLLENEWLQDSSTVNQPKVEDECCKVHNVCLQTKAEHPIDCQKFSSWRKLIRVTAYILRLIWILRAQRHNKTHPEENEMKPREGPLSPQELQNAENYWIKEGQKSLQGDRLRKGELKNLSLYTDPDGIVWVGGRADKELASYEMRHPALLPREHRISLLITQHVHQGGHTAVAATVAKTRTRFWIL